jgi:hypothetical protein
MRARLVGAVLATIVYCGIAEAQSPCDQFKWPVRREMDWLSSTKLFAVVSGAELAGDGAFSLALQPMASVKYVVAPERQPKSFDTFGGFVTILAPSHSGTYQITLSEEAWIDVVQDGRSLASSAFSGNEGCGFVRKSVRFEIAAGPVIIQISGAGADHIAIAAAPAM